MMYSMTGWPPDGVLKPIAHQMLGLTPPTDRTQFMATQAEWRQVILGQLDELIETQAELPTDLAIAIKTNCPGWAKYVDMCKQADRELVSA